MCDQHISARRGALRDGRYCSGLPENISIRAAEAAEHGLGIMGWELPWNTAAQSHCSSPKSDFYCDMIEVIIPGLGHMRGRPPPRYCRRFWADSESEREFVMICLVPVTVEERSARPSCAWPS